MSRWRNCSSDPVTPQGSEGHAGVLTQAQSQRIVNERESKRRGGASAKRTILSDVVRVDLTPETKLPSGLHVRTCRGFPFALLWKVHCCTVHQMGNLVSLKYNRAAFPVCRIFRRSCVQLQKATTGFVGRAPITGFCTSTDSFIGTRFLQLFHRTSIFISMETTF